MQRRRVPAGGIPVIVPSKGADGLPYAEGPNAI
jgi:hypothetical protein